MKPLTPQLTHYPKRTVLTIGAIGSPSKVFPKLMPSLYGTAYGTKFKVFKPKNVVMKIGQLICAYPNADRQPKTAWKIVCDLEVPNFVKASELVQKQPKLPVALKHRPAGQYAEILHIGSYSRVGPSIKKLLAFIAEHKLKVAGPHEEVYLSRPGPKAKTIIRYMVKPKSVRKK